MFWKKPKNDGLAQHIIEQYEQAIEKDSTMQHVYFEALYAALSHDPNPAQLAYIGRVAAELIRGKDAFWVARLMHYCYVDPTPADPKQWKKHCTPEGYRALLICGTAHPNGFFRERCLRLLEGEQDVLQFVLLRMNDWVPEVRRLAQCIAPGMVRLLTEQGSAALITAMPFVEYVRRGERARREAWFPMHQLDALLRDCFAKYPQSVVKSPVYLRRLCYKAFLLHPEETDKALLLYFIQHERDGAQRSTLVRSYLQGGSVSPEQLAVFMQDKYWRVRLDAYEYRMKTEGAWNGLERLLLSRSYPIREFAAYYLEQNGFDSLGYCRGNLPESILALCDLGTKDDIPRIRPYLGSRPRESLLALVRLGAEDSEALIWKSMHAENAKLAKTAYRLAAAQPRFAPAQLLPEIENEPDPQLRWRLIRLLGNVGDWNIMPILIRLVRDYSHIRPDILNMIAGRSSFRTSISPELAQEIHEALAYAGTLIPERIAEDLLFDVKRLSA